MAFCSNCGTQLSEGAKFCPKCGTSISPVPNENSGKSSSKRIVIPLIALILILAIAGGGWYIWKNQSEDYSLEGLAKAIVNYDVVGEFHCGRAHVIKYVKTPDGGVVFKYGYIDKMGTEIIPCKYEGDEMTDYEFHDGLTAVSNGRKYAYIDVDGKEITSFIYDETSRFSDGFAVAKRDEKYYIIDSSGKEIVELKYSADLYRGDCFEEGLFPVYDESGYGFVNSKGELVIPCKYTSTEEGICPFADGLAPVYNGEKYGYIDKTGKEVIPFIYDAASSFSEGLAVVVKDNKRVFIDKNGQKVFDRGGGYMGEGFNDGFYVDYSEDGLKRFYIDKTGKNAFGEEYDMALPFKEGYACVGKKYGDDYLYGFIDKKGKEVIPCKYKSLWSLSEGLALIQDDDLYGFVDIHGNSTFDIENEEVKNLVQKKMKEKEEEREEERKRIEEENKPYNKFKSVISQNSFVWEGPSVESDHVEVLYFNQLNNSIGKVSLVTFKNTFTSYSMRWSGNGTYSIVDDIVEFYIEWKMTNFAREPRGEKIVLRIENYGDNVKLVDVKSNRTYLPKRATVNNPLR